MNIGHLSGAHPSVYSVYRWIDFQVLLGFVGDDSTVFFAFYQAKGFMNLSPFLSTKTISGDMNITFSRFLQKLSPWNKPPSNREEDILVHLSPSIDSQQIQAKNGASKTASKFARFLCCMGGQQKRSCYLHCAGSLGFQKTNPIGVKGVHCVHLPLGITRLSI